MLRFYLFTALNFIRRNLAFSFINILGLSLGLALVTIAMLWVQFEFSYDKFHENADRIFRVVVQFNSKNNPDNFSGTPAPLGEAMKNDIPGVVEFVRFGSLGRTLVSNEEGQFWENVDLADPSVFKIFSFKLLMGDSSTALIKPNSLIISETKAGKYFGNRNPIGQLLFLGAEKIPFTITGVMKNIPPNSQINFNLLSSFSNITDKNNLGWNMWNYTTYILAKDKYSCETITEKLEGLGKKYIKETSTRLFLQPLTRIHLHSNLRDDIETNANTKTLSVFILICLLVLIVACVNYMNLATARYTRRGKEVGLRKVSGASQSNLVFQFMLESFVMTLTAFIFGLIICYLLLPVFGFLTGIKLNFALLFHFQNLGIIIILIFITSILSGSYPAFVLSSLNPVSAIHNDFRKVNTLSVRQIRKMLVVFQFVVAIILIGCTIIIHSQLTLIRNKNLGMMPDQVIVVPIFQDEIKHKYGLFKNEILTNPDVLNASATNYYPGDLGFRRDVWWEGLQEDDRSNAMDWITADPDFAKTFRLEILKGVFFPPGITGNSSIVYVVNESAVKKFRWQDPLGKQLDIIGKGDVIGVVRDFNYRSLHNAMEPMAFAYYPERLDNLMIRISKENIPATLKFLHNKWESFFPQYPFEYSFLSSDFQKMYEKDVKTYSIIMYISFMAFCIAGMGLFGLVLFSVDRRVKEIGLRKVAGASSLTIMFLFNIEFIRRIFISFVISCPVIIYFMRHWLDNFAYRIKIGWWMITLAGLIPFCISLILVSWLTWRSATKNPAECLRHE